MITITKSPEETTELAKEIAKKITSGTVVLLEGELGAGKTQFVKGLAEGLGIDEVVTSPTFVIVNEYKGKDLTLYHIDLYRLDGFPSEDIDIDEMLEDGVVAVEWWEKDRDFFRAYKPRLEVYFKILDDKTRQLKLDWVK